MTTICRSCKAPIVWAQTDKGKKIPLDPEPDEKGNLIVWAKGDQGTWFVRVAHKDEVDQDFGRYISHFATCPDAAKHRRA